jgi:hypothetical protein
VRPFAVDTPIQTVKQQEGAQFREDAMSKFSKQGIADSLATLMKVVGALMLGVAVAPISAFAALLAGCSISVITALRTGDRSAAFVNGAFAFANALGIARATGLLG